MCLAGLWEDSLVSDLCWEISRAPRENGEARNTDSSSPTWSWTSSTGAVYFERETSLQRYCEVLDIIYTPLNPLNPRGQVSHAKLTIRGHILKVLLKDGKIDVSGMQQKCSFDYNICLPGPGFVAEGSALFCLTISVAGARTFSALILRCIDEKAQVYERIGFLNGYTQNLDWFLGLYPTWRSNLNKNEGLAVRRIPRKSIAPLDVPGEGGWFLPPEEAEKKERGDEYKEFYLGKIVHIV